LDSVFKEPDVFADLPWPRKALRDPHSPSVDGVPHSSRCRSHRQRAFPSRERDPSATTRSIPHPSRSTAAPKRGEITRERDVRQDLAMHIHRNVPFPAGNVSRRMWNEPFPARRIAFPVGNVIRHMGNKAPAVMAGALGGLCITLWPLEIAVAGDLTARPTFLILCTSSPFVQRLLQGVSSDGERAGNWPELIDNRWTLARGNGSGAVPSGSFHARRGALPGQGEPFPL
jgi:hypothetical protein